MKAISIDLRERIFAAYQAGESSGDVAERFAVSPAFVRRLAQRHRETGSLEPKGGRRGPRPRLEGRHDDIRRLNRERPDLTPAEVRDRLGLAASALTVWRALRALGLTFKKSPSGPRSGTGRTSPRPAASGRRPSPGGAPSG